MQSLRNLTQWFSELSPDAFRVAIEMVASADESGEVWRSPNSYFVKDPRSAIAELVAAEKIVEVVDESRRFVYRILWHRRFLDEMIAEGARLKHRNYQRQRAAEKAASKKKHASKAAGRGRMEAERADAGRP